MTHLLGLTGSIGMGKSTTARMFADAGIPVWDADATVHDLYQGPAVPSVAAVFPNAIVDGIVSRGNLKAILAEDPAALAQLEKIVHPLVAASRQDFIASHSDPILLFDIPLLFETGAEEWLTSVVVVTVPADVQRARVMARPGMTDEQFDFILSHQMPDAEKRDRADYVIETLTLDDTRKSVQHLIETLKAKPHA